MPKKFLILLLFLTLLASACQSATPSSPTATRAPENQATLPPGEGQGELPTSTSAGPPASTQPSASLGDTIQCTVVSQLPTPGPTEQSIFPPVGASDWVMGTEMAAVTFTEYGDFQ